jgi:hypothetical protein
VFESLQLAEFGNRIPTLSFEVVADDGEVTLAQILEPLEEPFLAQRSLAGLAGFSDEGGPLGASLATIDQVYPIVCDAGGDALSIASGEPTSPEPLLLPAAALDATDESFGAATGRTHRRKAGAGDIPSAVRYYDPARDYQASVQRADGRARPGRSETLEVPAAFSADTARTLANAAADRAGWSRETLAWRLAELNPALVPGQPVRAPGCAGVWRIASWEWRDSGIELELHRLPPDSARSSPADAGEALPKPDLVATPTQLVAFELPWDGLGAGDTRQAFAAASSLSAGWKSAALYADQGGELIPLGAAGPRRTVIGYLAGPAPASAAMLLERQATIEVDLVSTDFLLSDATIEGMALGANRAVLGEELIQFATATSLGGSRWRLGGLLRGRGSTEPAALAGHPAGTPFVLLDGNATLLDPTVLGRTGDPIIAAIGIADSVPVLSSLLNAGATTRPLTPVHPGQGATADGATIFRWIRRARGAWSWPDYIETPVNEQAERYVVGLGEGEAPSLRWELTEPRLELSAATMAELHAAYPGQPLWVRQIGSFALSDPLLLTIL